VFRDVNMEVAGALNDVALVHASKHGRFAYKKAARAVLTLEEPLVEFVERHELREIPYIGPATERVILEHLETGKSPTVEKTVQASGKRDEVKAARAYRKNFLSRSGVLRALAARAPGAVTLADYRGDLQTHSTWSDGGESIARLAAAARERGYAYLGVSDHAYGLRIANGMSMSDARLRAREIDAWNSRADGAFHVLSTVEANIPADGGVDMTSDELAEFELVLAAPHSKLRRSEDQTDRMLAAVRHPGVHVLAHPRGRMYSRRGVLARWDEVFEEARKQGVAIEIDGDPYRQDLDFALAAQALAAGCLFALDSDAHAGAELLYAEYAIAHARLAGIPAKRIINTWTYEKLMDWAEERRA
jgi:histidinol phosphatase-like PHP family hydrolase